MGRGRVWVRAWECDPAPVSLTNERNHLRRTREVETDLNGGATHVGWKKKLCRYPVFRNTPSRRHRFTPTNCAVCLFFRAKLVRYAHYVVYHCGTPVLGSYVMVELRWKTNFRLTLCFFARVLPDYTSIFHWYIHFSGSLQPYLRLYYTSPTFLITFHVMFSYIIISIFNALLRLNSHNCRLDWMYIFLRSLSSNSG